ncbi:acyltransferase [Alginatibacterium sediminis]|uniref:Acyltransferase n=1 Tax=Alginatibacterium sediminis TaxID=2164068 RepID=A0A420EDE9_9ALTE|nr:acyltransferase [Alginatibacterium sediminis]RKF18727.1 acyltransferase [Alginatibacterium sediminis]
MYKSLQSGRAIAALLVVLFHLGGTIAKEKYFDMEAFFIPFSFGGFGVDFFFVLSGFIIYHAHKNDIGQPKALPSYLYKRITRIYPVYLIIFTAVYLLALSIPQLRATVPHDFSTLLKSVLLFPQDKAIVGAQGAPVVIVAWTLQFEMLFYLVFSLGILNRRLGLLAVLGFACVSVFAPTTVDFPLSFFSSDYIWLFLMGMVCAKLSTQTEFSTILSAFLAVLGMFIFVSTSLDVVLAGEQLKSYNILLNGIAFSCIVLSLVAFEKKGKVLLNNKFSQLLGASSYALYLIHFPLISIMCKIAMLLGLQRAGVYGAFFSFVVIFFACILSSIVFHLVIEKPISNKLRYRLSSATTKQAPNALASNS